MKKSAAFGLAFFFTLMITFNASYSFASDGRPDRTQPKTVGRNINDSVKNKRVALVLANASYQTAPLSNPLNDAHDMRGTLERMGFKVIQRTDIDRRSMKSAIDEFHRLMRDAEVGLFYYAGHGVQVSGENFLIPLHAHIKTTSDIEYESVNFGRVLGKMREAGCRLNIVILDACRANPFRSSFRVEQKGLAKMDAPAGTIIAFATSPGSTAEDGRGRNGTYTGQLLQYIERQDLTVMEMFNEVGRAVMKKTGDRQVPWISSTPVPPYRLSRAPIVPKFKSETQTGKTSVDYNPSRITIVPKPKGSIHGPSTDLKVAVQPGGNRKHITNGLGMTFVWIAPGTFMMGQSEGERQSLIKEIGQAGYEKHFADEIRHGVTLTKGFYLQTTETTQGQWQAVMGTNPSKFRNGDNYPVEKVHWDKVQKFIAQLNRMDAAMTYRLPYEAEWEYAARAGTTTPFAFGTCLTADLANFDGNYPMAGCPQDRYRQQTVAVASFAPNAWGLYDMHGNVWEWCQDWYGKYPKGSTIDPKGPSSGKFRVFRGGAWSNHAKVCRSANRKKGEPKKKGGALGFRLIADTR